MPKLKHRFWELMDHNESSRMLMTSTERERVSSKHEVYIRLGQEAARMGLRANDAKTKYMHISRPFTTDEYNFENVAKFKYLGSTDSDMIEEIK